MPFVNWKAMVDADNAGQSFFSAWRKTPTQTTGAGIWFDLSMSPGNPVPNYYAASPNIAVRLAQSTDGGIPHGSNVSGKKYLKSFTVMTTSASAAPMSYMLCDYLLFYPFVDMSITDPQALNNTVTLSRYTSGKNVKIMAVEVAGQNGVGNPQFYVTYTNSDGVSGRTTKTVSCNTQVVNGTIINSQPTQVNGRREATGPFLPLQDGDTGVQKIDSVTFVQGDIGLIAFVLVYPLENIAQRSIDAPMERVPVVDFMDLPVIENDAYLNLICCPNASLAGAPLMGTIETFWN